MNSNLRLDWCSREAAKYAVEHWHYSQTMPVSKMNSIGVWENTKFIGAVLFSWGANPNLSKAYGLKMTECAELVRVALTQHIASVSRILKIAIAMIKTKNSGLRLLVSFADTAEGHHGGIYQAGNWIFDGDTKQKFDYIHRGKRLQRRAYTGCNFGKGKKALPVDAIKVISPPKHRYLFPLDDAMKKQIEPLRKPYPKRIQSVDSDTPTNQLESGGAIPTRMLITKGTS